MINTHTCISVECDDCGTDTTRQGRHDHGPYETAQDAITAALNASWQQLPDGRMLCQSCALTADCQTTGHQLTDWWRPTPDTAVELRYCEHCGGGIEERAVLGYTSVPDDTSAER